MCSSDLFERGRPLVHPRIAQMGQAVTEVGVVLGKVESMLRNLSGKPGAARTALDDAREQIASLLPKGLLLHVPMDRLGHLPRYLRAIQVRLERLPNDPRRDADKAAQVVPVWQSFRERREALRSRGVPEDELESFRWLVEELRVCLFAPELKSPLPVSPQKVAERWKSLSG